MLMEINPRALIVLILVVCCVFYLGASTSTILVPVFCICTPCLFFYLYLTKWVLAKNEGPPEMSEVDYKCGQEEAGCWRGSAAASAEGAGEVCAPSRDNHRQVVHYNWASCRRVARCF